MITEKTMKEITEHSREILTAIQKDLAMNNESIPEDQIIKISLTNGLIDFYRDIRHIREYGPF